MFQHITFFSSSSFSHSKLPCWSITLNDLASFKSSTYSTSHFCYSAKLQGREQTDTSCQETMWGKHNTIIYPVSPLLCKGLVEQILLPTTYAFKVQYFFCQTVLAELLHYRNINEVSPLSSGKKETHIRRYEMKC